MGDNSMQAIWAATDKPSIDRMKCRVPRIAAHFDNPHSSEDSSESDQESEASFLAVPREFRPNISPKLVPKKSVKKSSALTQGLKRFPISSTLTKSKNDSTLSNSISPPYAGAIFTNKPLACKLNDKRENAVDSAQNIKQSHNVTTIDAAEKKGNVCFEIKNADQARRSLVTFGNAHAKSLPGCNNYREPQVCFEIKNKDPARRSQVPFEDAKADSLPVYNHYREPQQKDKPKSIEFECFNVTKHTRITKNKIIEIDIANLNLDKKANKVLKDASTLKTPSEVKKAMPRKPKNKNQKHYYQQNKKEHSSVNYIQPRSKEDTIKWNSTLGLNNTRQTMTRNEKAAGKIKNALKENVIEWSVIKEESECIPDTRLPINNFNDKDIVQHFLKKYENIRLPYRCPEEVMQPIRDSSCRDNYRKQQRQNVSKEETGYSDFHSFTNNLAKMNNLENIQYRKIDWELLHKEQDSSTTPPPENVFTQIPEDFNETSHFSEKCHSATSEKEHYFSKTLPSDDTKKKYHNFDEYSFVCYGKEISDLVIGSHIALNALFSIHNEWKQLRHELIEQFQLLEKSMQDTSQKYERFQDLLVVGSNIATVASAVPHPYVSIAAKVLSILSSLLSKFAKNSGKTKIEMDEPEIGRLLQNDIENSAELYMHGLQCNMQFEETRKIIEEFHSTVKNYDLKDTNPDISAFIEGLTVYTPKHRVFYKKIYKCYQELLHNTSSLCGIKFGEPFSLYDLNAVNVIEYLDWQFIEVDNATVEAELREIQDMIQNNSGSTSMKDLVSKIKNCISILKHELESVKKCLGKIPLLQDLF